MLAGLVHLLLRGGSAFVGSWPESWVVALARVVGRMLFDVARYRRQVILSNLAQAFPERSVAERVALGREATVHLVRSLLEFLRIPRYAKAGFPGVTVEGLEHYLAAHREGHGVLILTGHLGSFELAAAAMAARLKPNALSLVVKDFPLGVERFVSGVRTGAGLGLIPAGGGRGMAPIRADLRGNGAVAFVLDQNATRRLGVFVDFFGRPASTMAALAVVALRSGAPVIPFAAHREPGGGHRLVVHPAIPLERGGSMRDTVLRMTRRYTEFIEARIREHPAEWLWTHRRWRTRPEAAQLEGPSTTAETTDV
jgi:KDO2-lipid IV(A) lauroyltransferase